MKPKLTLRDLFWLVLVCALVCLWWGERAKFQELQETEHRLGQFLVGDLSFPVLEAHETMEVNVKDDRRTLVVRIKKAGRTIVEKEFENPYAPFECGITIGTNSGP